MNNKIKEIQLNTLLEEQRFLREEINILNNAFIKIYFTSLTLTIASIGVYFGKSIIDDDKTRAYLLFGSSQLVLFMYFFLIQMLCSTNVHAAYLTEIERKIRNITKMKFSCWESYCCMEHIYKWPSPFVLSSIFEIIMICAIVSIGIQMAYSELDKIYLYVIITEVFIVTALTWYTVIYRGKVQKIISNHLS